LLQDLDRLALPAEAVVGVVAELQREGVDDVLARRGRAPRVVAPAAELDIEVGAGEGRAARVDARAGGRGGRVDVLLHEQLRREVAGLRAEDGERAPGGRLARG